MAITINLMWKLQKRKLIFQITLFRHPQSKNFGTAQTKNSLTQYYKTHNLNMAGFPQKIRLA